MNITRKEVFLSLRERDELREREADRALVRFVKAMAVFTVVAVAAVIGSAVIFVTTHPLP